MVTVLLLEILFVFPRGRLPSPCVRRRCRSARQGAVLASTGLQSAQREASHHARTGSEVLDFGVAFRRRGCAKLPRATLFGRACGILFDPGNSAKTTRLALHRGNSGRPMVYLWRSSALC